MRGLHPLIQVAPMPRPPEGMWDPLANARAAFQIYLKHNPRPWRSWSGREEWMNAIGVHGPPAAVSYSL